MEVAGVKKSIQKGSYTIEAALTIPILIFVMVIAMKLGITLLQEIREQNEVEVVENLWEVKDFYKVQGIGELKHD
jgi:hypothetical protein